MARAKAKEPMPAREPERWAVAPLDFRGKHLEFLRDTTPEIDIEGGRNSGKTWACCAKVLQNCLDYPGIEWLICRYSGTETDSKLRPEFERIARFMGIELEWNADQLVYLLPEKGGKRSKVYAYGLKTQNQAALYAKIRGLGVASVLNDQTEELPENIATELRFALRQPGYPHQLIFAPNPTNEDHFLADQFPDADSQLPGRALYRVNLYDNAHNLDPKTITQVEQAFPPTHARYKSLVLGQRGVNVIGSPVYEHAFRRADHVVPVAYDPDSDLLEAYASGQHHPAWIVAQRASVDGLRILGGIMGKKLSLAEFLPIVARYRREWFGSVPGLVCTDPPPDAYAARLRFTNVSLLKQAGLFPVWADNATAPDVRETVIQSLTGYMQRRVGVLQGFAVSNDPSRWLMASHAIIKRSNFFVDALEGAYVWDEHLISVGSKKVRQPKTDPWVDGAQRCLENLALNFCVDALPRTEEAETELPEYRPVSRWG